MFSCFNIHVYQNLRTIEPNVRLKLTYNKINAHQNFTRDEALHALKLTYVETRAAKN